MYRKLDRVWVASRGVSRIDSVLFSPEQALEVSTATLAFTIDQILARARETARLFPGHVTTQNFESQAPTRRNSHLTFKPGGG